MCIVFSQNWDEIIGASYSIKQNFIILSLNRSLGSLWYTKSSLRVNISYWFICQSFYQFINPDKYYLVSSVSSFSNQIMYEDMFGHSSGREGVDFPLLVSIPQIRLKYMTLEMPAETSGAMIVLLLNWAMKS